jgi:hypothetical protein
VSAEIDELYELPAGEFVAARDRLATDLRRQGRAQEAAAVKGLRRPGPAAAALNALARADPALIRELRTTGDRLRRTQADAVAGRAGDLSALSKERRTVVDQGVRRATALAADADSPLSASAADQVRASLEAVLVDELAAARLAEGRLSAPIELPAFGGLLGAEGGPPVVVAPTRRSKAAAPARKPAKEVERRRADVAAAQERHRDARRERLSLAQQVADLERDLRQARLRLERAEKTEAAAAEGVAAARRRPAGR